MLQTPYVMGLYGLEDPSPFNHLQLLAELRLLIYEAVLTGKDSTAALLATCQQINMEAQEVLYRRPTSFSSQAKLFAWVERSRATNLNRVRTVTLHLTDVDLDALLDQSASKRSTRTGVWSLYKQNLEMLNRSLSALPKLSSLTIIPPTIGRSHLLRNMYHSFLAEIPKRCPKLKRIEIHDSDELLHSVPQLNDIKDVIFTESSGNSSTATAGGRRESASVSKKPSNVMAKKRRRTVALCGS